MTFLQRVEKRGSAFRRNERETERANLIVQFLETDASSRAYWHEYRSDGSHFVGTGISEGSDLLVAGSQANVCALINGKLPTSEHALLDIRIGTTPHDLRPLPPFDIPGNSDAPLLHGATIRVLYRLHSGPFVDDLVYVESFLDGQLTGYALAARAGEVTHGGAAVTIEGEYSALLKFRAGDLTALEALNFARIAGPVPHLSLLGGLIESGHYLSHIRQQAHVASRVAAWVRHLGDASHRDLEA